MCLSSVNLPLTTLSGSISLPVLQIRCRFHLASLHTGDVCVWLLHVVDDAFRSVLFVAQFCVCSNSHHSLPTVSCCWTTQRPPSAHNEKWDLTTVPPPDRTAPVQLEGPPVDGCSCGCSISAAITGGGSAFLVTSSFLHVSECDIVPPPSQRGQPGETLFSSTHLCVS